MPQLVLESLRKLSPLALQRTSSCGEPRNMSENIGGVQDWLEAAAQRFPANLEIILQEKLCKPWQGRVQCEGCLGELRE